MTAHPLDPLTADEVALVADALGRDHDVRADDGWRFAMVELAEPGKDALDAYADDASQVPPREAVATVFSRRDSDSTHHARVDLGAGGVTSFEHVPGVQPNVTIDEWEEAHEAVSAHPDVVAALAARGITDTSLVFHDTWTFGAEAVPEAYRGRRVGWTDTWVRASEGANPYAGPVGGLHCVIDLGTMQVLDVDDTGAVERPEVMGEYVPRLVPEGLRGHRPARAPLEITQPEGPGFELDGHLLRWQNWSMRIGFTPREGLVLHAVTYDDAGRTRPVAHRMSFAEMVVPYRDPAPDHVRRTAFDIGEWGLGFLTQSLALGCDCLGEIRYLDAVVHDSAGSPVTIEQAVCVHEEDAGVLWKHVDAQSGAEVRRMRRLVVSFQVTVANYEYIVYWRFYEDGSIECEVRATGIMVVTHLPEGGEHPHGALVDQRTYAPFHQHFIVARLDLDVDGASNTVYRTETQQDPVSAEDPNGLGLRQVYTPFVSESDAADDPSWQTQRSWIVRNDNVTTGLGLHPAYKLVPGGAIPSMLHAGSPVLERAQVVGHTVWVTAHDLDERWPAGEFVNQGGPGQGVPAWQAADRPLTDADVVLWYVFGIHHVTRPEDWPVMPSDTVSFWLKPQGFFDRNPALDVEPPVSHC